MKINTYQKILLAIYGIVFIYLSILHVPFKIDYDEIAYDTLFSSKSNLIITRLVLIDVVITIVSVVLFLLLRNLTLKIKYPSKRLGKISIYIFVIITLFLLTILAISRYKGAENKMTLMPERKVDSVAATTKEVPLDSLRALTKSENCTQESALKAFRSYMNFYYPDWKIYGNPVIKEMSDCIYRVQFSTMDPHIKWEREVIIAEISLNDDGHHYKFKTIRGELY
jgi:hypothetical protein